MIGAESMESYKVKENDSINNDMFKEYSKYYRNALVRSNYGNYAKGIDVEFRFLEYFYDNLLFEGKFELRSDQMML